MKFWIVLYIRASVGNSTGRVAGYSLIPFLEKIQNLLIVFNYFSIYTLFFCRICIWSLTQFPIFWLFLVKTTLELILITCQPISGRVDATRCSKLTGGFPPVPPTLTEGLTDILLYNSRNWIFNGMGQDRRMVRREGWKSDEDMKTY